MLPVEATTLGSAAAERDLVDACFDVDASKTVSRPLHFGVRWFPVWCSMNSKVMVEKERLDLEGLDTGSVVEMIV